MITFWNVYVDYVRVLSPMYVGSVAAMWSREFSRRAVVCRRGMKCGRSVGICSLVYFVGGGGS